MAFYHQAAWLAGGLILTRWLAELWLAQLNRRHVLLHAGQLPPAFQGIMDEVTYAKSTAYTLARSRLGIFSDTLGALVLLTVLFSGVLPRAFEWVQQHTSGSAWMLAAFLFLVGAALALPGLPVDWFEQFKLEQRFGFNTTTQSTWWLDRVKMFLLAAVLGYPLLVLLLKLVEWTGDWWWLWAWLGRLCWRFSS